MIDVINTLGETQSLVELGFSWTPATDFTFTAPDGVSIEASGALVNVPLTFRCGWTFGGEGIFGGPGIFGGSGPFVRIDNQGHNLSGPLALIEFFWDFGDGTTGYGNPVIHTYKIANPQAQTVLRITDAQGGQWFTRKQMYLGLGTPPTGPIARFSYHPSAPNVATVVDFDASASTDGLAPITAYTWDFGDSTSDRRFGRFGTFGRNGTFGEDTNDPTGDGITVQHTYFEANSYTVTVTVSDILGNSATATHVVTVTAVGEPLADFTYSPSSPTISDAIHFDASTSTDVVSITSYAWDFGDGHTATGLTPTHTYSANGSYTVKLTITDSLAAESTISKTVVVSAAPPSAAFSFSPSSPSSGQTITFNSSASTSGVSITSYAWDFGDSHNATGASPTHVYSVGGSYTVGLTITDALSRTSTVTHVVAVTGVNTFGGSKTFGGSGTFGN